MSGRRREFDESDHPRHPAGTGQGGQFRGLTSLYRDVHRVDGGWAKKLSGQIASRFKPGRWDTVTPGRYRQEWREGMLAEFRRQRMDQEAAQGLLDEVGRELSPPVAVYRNGPHRVVVETNSGIPTEDLLAHVDDLLLRFPGRGPATISIVDQKSMPEERGLTLFPASVVYLRADMFGEWDGTQKLAMPASRQTPQWKYILTHEWGHVISPTDILRSGRPQDMFEEHKGSLSTYGGSHQTEAVGEAFAEWFLTRGRTGNTAAQAYAEWLGWEWR